MRCGAITCAQPDQFRRATLQHAAIVEIQILRDDRETVLECVLPDVCIVRSAKPAVMNMAGIWKQVRQASDKLRGEILIEEQLHQLQRRSDALGRPQMPNKHEYPPP